MPSPARAARACALALVLLLGACETPPPGVPPTPPEALPGKLRPLSHADPPAEVLVYDHRRARRFVVELASAIDVVNRSRAPGDPAIELTVLHWRYDRGAARPDALDESLVRRIAVRTRFDSWVQDFVEIAASDVDGGLVLLDPNRGTGLEALVPELALRWGAHWVRLPPAARASASGAGNLEGLPDGTWLLGTTAGPALADYLGARSDPARLLRVDTSWLAIGHVDEILSHVVTGPPPCGFALVRASPAWAAALADRASGAERGTQRVLDARIAGAARAIQASVAARGCPPPPIVGLPVSFDCEGSPDAPRRCRTTLPNAVNMTVLDRHVLVPDPGATSSRSAIRQALESYGQHVRFLDAGFLQERGGGVHCATNVRRRPRPWTIERARPGRSAKLRPPPMSRSAKLHSRP